jgi:GT2 family glycosyltransferase
MRPDRVIELLRSIRYQELFPFEIIIVDGSTNLETKNLINDEFEDLHLKYYLVNENNRGLTRQRNFGVTCVDDFSDIIAFLDDDVILNTSYFRELAITFSNYPESIGVGGIDLHENLFFKKEINKRYDKFNYYELDGWIQKEPVRYKIRKIFGLMSDLPPDFIPSFSNGRSGFPPSGKIYQVEHLMGLSMCFRKSVFDKISFSRYFEGYGLYEDFDFCVRALSYGSLLVNTNATLYHFHDPGGRPNTYRYGKMVIRNGWYVWRLRFNNPDFLSVVKWHSISFLLAFLRLINAILGPKRKEAFFEVLGRTNGWISLFINPPIIHK